MNILYLLGNGFDVNLGMKTRYRNFYNNAYQIKKDDIDLIKGLKKDIEGNINDWADLEKKLGEYTAKLKNKKEFYTLFDDIREKLVDYFRSQEISKDDCIAIRSKILRDMRFPFTFLTPGEKGTFLQYLHAYQGNETNISAISFNYTDSLEKIIDFPQKKIKLPDDVGNITTYFNPPIEHIHGDINKRFILGVDNIGQIANEAFKNDEDIVDAFVKPKQNAESRELVDVRCKKLIDDANIICIFGMSIGPTDATWWDYIGRLLTAKNKRLIIFFKGDEISPIFDNKIQEQKRNVMNEFISFVKIEEASKNLIKQYIHVIYNSPEMFNVDGLMSNKDTKLSGSSSLGNTDKTNTTDSKVKGIRHKAHRTRLKVTFPDGKVIEERYAFETLKEVVQIIGVERINRLNITICNIPLISNKLDEVYASSQKSLSNGLYLMTSTSTKSKKQLLDKISDAYNLGLKVEIISK